MLLEPAHVDKAVFSTLFNDKSVLKSAALLAVTVLSALILMNVTAAGFVRVKMFEPTVVAPKLVLAPDSVEAPVPPSAMARSVMPVIEPPVIATLLAACDAMVPSVGVPDRLEYAI
jgi:hypothetical protein